MINMAGIQAELVRVLATVGFSSTNLRSGCITFIITADSFNCHSLLNSCWVSRSLRVPLHQAVNHRTPAALFRVRQRFLQDDSGVIIYGCPSHLENIVFAFLNLHNLPLNGSLVALNREVFSHFEDVRSHPLRLSEAGDNNTPDTGFNCWQGHGNYLITCLLLPAVFTVQKY